MANKLKKNHFFAEGGPSAKKPPTALAPDGLFSLPRAVLALGKDPFAV